MKADQIDRESFVFYKSFREAIENLPKENQLNAFIFISQYGLFGTIPDGTSDPIAYAIFIMAKPQIDANNKRFLNGLKGGRPKDDWENLKKPNTNQTQTKPKPNVNVNVNENANGNENVNGNENEKKQKTKQNKEEEDLKNKKIHKKIAYSNDFESFWKAYPKKKGKQKAWEAWENAIKGGNDPKVLITKAGEYATEVKLKRVEDKFIKFPQGRLNDGRFDDDYFTGNNGIKPNLDDLY